MKLTLTIAALLLSSTGAFALGAMTPRPDCPVVQTDPSDVNHPVTYQCAQGVGGGKYIRPDPCIKPTK